MLNIKTILLIYTWRETGLIFSLCEILYKISGNPGEFDVRVQCMLIGLGFDLVGYILMTLPYLFMWDFTDEKHAHVMEVLKQRAEAGNAAADCDISKTNNNAVNTEAATVSQQE